MSTELAIAVIIAIVGGGTGFAALINAWRTSGPTADKYTADASATIVGGANDVVTMLREQMADLHSRLDQAEARILLLETEVGTWEVWAERVLDLLDRALGMMADRKGVRGSPTTWKRSRHPSAAAPRAQGGLTMARYCPEHVTQEDGSECEWEHCWAATGAWLAAGASGGAKTPTPVTFCSRAGKSPCQNGGLSDMIRGLMTMDLWGRCKYRADVPKADLRALLMRRSGALVALEIDMDSWPESNGDEYHSIGVICGGGTGPNKGQVKTMDPAEHRYNWRDVDGVIAAAAEYNREHRELPGTIDALIVLPPMED